MLFTPVTTTYEPSAGSVVVDWWAPTKASASATATSSICHSLAPLARRNDAMVFCVAGDGGSQHSLLR